VRLLPRSGYPELFPSVFTIDVSTDAVNWTQAASESTYTAQDSIWYDKNFSTQNVRYVRLATPASKVAANDFYYVQIAEFEVYDEEVAQSDQPATEGSGGQMLSGAGGDKQVVLTWTAPGTRNGGTTGAAAGYETRYSTQEMTSEAAWAAANTLEGEPAPEETGTTQSMTITMDIFPAETRLYFAVRAKDDAGNESVLSNSPSVDTPADQTPPAAITDLATALVQNGSHPQLSASSATSSGDLYGTHVAANAIDGDETTLWSSEASDGSPRAEYLTLNLGTTYTVAKVRLLPRANWPELFPSNFTIDVSTDGDNWTQAASESGCTAQSGVWYEKVFAGQSARYVRLTVPASKLAGDGSNRYYIQLTEFEVFAQLPWNVQLSWTAPGDNRITGTVAGYDARYATVEITDDAAWNSATQLDGEPTPETAGTQQSMTISADDLPAGSRLYFAIIATDVAGNESALSNSPDADTPADTTPPATITDLYASIVDTETPAKLTVTSASSSGDLYDRHVAANATDGDDTTLWSSEASLGSPRPEHITLDIGSVQSVRQVRMLPRPGWPHLFPDNFTIDVSTDGQNWTQAASETAYEAQAGVWYEKTFSPQSASHVRLTVPASMLNAPNGYYYVQLMEFEVYPLPAQAAQLTWTAPGDDGNIGAATSYDVRYSASDITDDAAWNNATPLSGEPSPQLAGGAESMSVSLEDLPPGARIYFAIRATDEGGNEGGVGSTASVDTPD